MELIYTVAVTAIVSGLVGSVVSSVVAALKSQGKKAVERSDAEKATDAAEKAGLRALLWRELKTIHEQAMEPQASRRRLRRLPRAGRQRYGNAPVHRRHGAARHRIRRKT